MLEWTLEDKCAVVERQRKCIEDFGGIPEYANLWLGPVLSNMITRDSSKVRKLTESEEMALKNKMSMNQMFISEHMLANMHYSINCGRRKHGKPEYIPEDWADI